MKVVYITGLAHSGSTLLSLLMGAHSRVTSIGEASRLRKFSQPEQKKPRAGQYACTCGAAIDDCAFWRDVNRHVLETTGKSLGRLNIGSTDPRIFAHDNLALFSAVARASRADVIVDSSKMPGRLGRLLDVADLDIVPIHIVRAPKGQVYSMQKKYGGVVSHAITYNLATWRIYKILAGRDHIAMEYERLANDVAGEMRRVMNSLGLELETSQLAWTDHVHHDIGGNSMRFSKKNSIVLDRSHESGLGTASGVAVEVLTVPAAILNRMKARASAPPRKPCRAPAE